MPTSDMLGFPTGGFTRMLNQTYLEASAADSTAATFPYTTAKPLVTGGKEYPNFKPYYNPQSSESWLKVSLFVPLYCHSGANTGVICIFRNDVGEPVQIAAQSSSGAAVFYNTHLVRWVRTGSTNRTFFTMRYGANAGSMYINSYAGTNTYGLAGNLNFSIEEWI